MSPSIVKVLEGGMLSFMLSLTGLFYDGVGNDIQAEYALMEAQKVNIMDAAQKQQHSKEMQISAEDEDEQHPGVEPEEEVFDAQVEDGQEEGDDGEFWMNV